MTENLGEVNWAKVDGRHMAEKSYAELEGMELALIASGAPEQLKHYADAAARRGNSELLAALATAAFMQFRIPQSEGYMIPQALFDGYQEAFDYIREASEQLTQTPQSD